MTWKVLLTCEHGGNAVPAPYAGLFAGHRRVLGTHRGLDIGASVAARHLESSLGAPLVCASVTRLLVDLNRSIGHPRLFSEFTRELPPAARSSILAQYYHPYRDLVAAWIAVALSDAAPVLHLSVHSFTPVLDGVARTADVGLLFDPARRRERAFCREWQARLDGADRWRVRRNYPYRGTSDGFVVALRRRFPAARYLGIELEMNQHLLRDRRRRDRLLSDLVATMPAG
jgi:predicted N-formylglutamate amidohydrolase